MRIPSKRTAENAFGNHSPKRPRLDPSQETKIEDIRLNWQNCTKPLSFLDHLKEKLDQNDYTLLCLEAATDAFDLQPIDLIKKQCQKIAYILKSPSNEKPSPFIPAFYSAHNIPESSDLFATIETMPESFVSIENWIKDYNLVLLCTKIKPVKELAIKALNDLAENHIFDLQATANTLKGRPICDIPSDLNLKNLGLTSFPEEITCFKLQILNLSRNWISCINPILSCPSLTKLNLSHNNINPNLRLPNSRCPSDIEILNLKDNRLSKIPEIVFQLPKLKELDISKNPIEEFPLELFQLKNLKCLKISSEQSIKIPELAYRHAAIIDKEMEKKFGNLTISCNKTQKASETHEVEASEEETIGNDFLFYLNQAHEAAVRAEADNSEDTVDYTSTEDPL